MTKNGVSYKELYDLMNQSRDDILNEFRAFKKEEFTPIKEKVERIWVYVTIGAAAATLLVEVGAKEVIAAFSK